MLSKTNPRRNVPMTKKKVAEALSDRANTDMYTEIHIRTPYLMRTQSNRSPATEPPAMECLTFLLNSSLFAVI